MSRAPSQPARNVGRLRAFERASSEFTNGFVIAWRRASFGVKAREETWRLLGDLVSAGISLTQAVETAAIVSQDAGQKTRAAILRDMGLGIARADFAGHVQRYVKGPEAMLFSAMGKSEAEGVFRAAARLAAQQNKLLAALRGALALPAILTLILGYISYTMGSQLFPIFEDIGGTSGWPWYTQVISAVTQWYANHVLWVVVPLLCIALGIALLLPRWHGAGRRIADRYPPFSLYKMNAGTGFIFTLIELGRMGVTIQPQLLTDLSRETSPYLKRRLSDISAGLRGKSLGAALKDAGHEFPARDLISVISALDGTAGWIERFAQYLDRYLDLIEHRVKEQTKILNGALLMLITVIIAGSASSMFALYNNLQ